ncbi:MAG: M28 family peptidase [Solirubrobacterales bacterium]
MPGAQSHSSADRAASSGEERELLEWITLLAATVGPRRPTSPAELRAADLIARRLREQGLDARLEPFLGYSTFALPFAITMGAAVAPGLVPRRRRVARSGLALAAVAALLSEGSLVRTPLGDLLSRCPSQNVVATIEPSAGAERTLCLMAHLDTSRSGFMFDPRVVGWMNRWITLNSALVLAGLAEPLAGRSRILRRVLGISRAALTGSLGILAEREVRGVDVAGANDNASGVAVVATLAAELAARPLASTRVVVCLTGCEEAGTLGSRAFLRDHETDGWLFLNVDNVAGSGSVRYLRREGVIAKWRADPGLIAAAEQTARAEPDLRMASEDAPAGLTYDSSPVLAAGGRALTLSVQDGFIPNLHQPSDTVENADADGVRRTLAAARGIVQAVDGGIADGPPP